MPDTDLGRDEIQALLDAATALQIPADSLKPINPFRSDMKSPTAQTIQMWLRENRPELAARMSGNSGHVNSALPPRQRRWGCVSTMPRAIRK